MFLDNCDGQVPAIFKDRKQCKAHLNLLSKLGRTACCALVINKQESLPEFDMIFDNTVMNKIDFEMNRKGSRCTNDDVNDPMPKIPNNFWSLVETFLELLETFLEYLETFLELLAALYLVLLPENVKHIGDKIIRVCCSHKNVLKMS